MKKVIVSFVTVLSLIIMAAPIQVFANEVNFIANQKLTFKNEYKNPRKSQIREKIKCYGCGRQVYKDHTEDIAIPHELAMPGVSGKDVIVQACAKGKNCCAKQLKNRVMMKRKDIERKRALGII